MTECYEGLLDIKDTVIESKTGYTEPLGSLSKEQSVGILASVSKKASQAPDVISDKGVGRYGLSKASLETAGVIKKGIPEPINYEDKTNYTGKYGVININDLLKSASLQKRIQIGVIEKRLAVLERQGVLLPDLTPEEQARLIGAAAQYTPEEINDVLNGVASPEITEGVESAMADAENAFNLVNSKANSLLEQVNGIGGEVLKPVQSAVDTIQTPSLNKALDDFIGSARVPSNVKPEDLFDKAKGLLDKGDLF